MKLTTEQVETFKRDGLLIAPGIISDADFAPVEAAYEAHIDAKARALLAAGKITDLCEGEPFSKRIFSIFKQNNSIIAGLDLMEARLPAAFHFLRTPNLMEAVECLIGPEISCNPIQHIRAKMPSLDSMGLSGVVPWHQDVGVTWDEADHTEIVTCWIPMVDATRENGCMEVIPGVNEAGYLLHQKEGGTMIMPELMPDLPVICAECPRGSVVFMSRFTPHRGLPNVSGDIVRWTMDLRYQPTGEPSGRPFYPSFVTQSAADPDSVLTDYDEWCRRWDAGLKAGEGQNWHRSRPRADLLKELALNQ